jgi:hypothetical protein
VEEVLVAVLVEVAVLVARGEDPPEAARALFLIGYFGLLLESVCPVGEGV